MGVSVTLSRPLLVPPKLGLTGICESAILIVAETSLGRLSGPISHVIVGSIPTSATRFCARFDASLVQW